MLILVWNFQRIAKACRRVNCAQVADMPLHKGWTTARLNVPDATRTNVLDEKTFDRLACTVADPLYTLNVTKIFERLAQVCLL
mgnify:CR=1 FL=1